MHTDMVSLRPSTSGLICSLVMLQKGSDFAYEELVEAMAKHYNPRPFERRHWIRSTPFIRAFTTVIVEPLHPCGGQELRAGGIYKHIYILSMHI